MNIEIKLLHLIIKTENKKKTSRKAKSSTKNVEIKIQQ